MTTMRSQSDKN